MSAAVPALPPEKPRLPYPPPSAVGARVHGARPLRPRPEDVEQLRRTLADHKKTCRACILGQKCDTARQLEQALVR